MVEREAMVGPESGTSSVSGRSYRTLASGMPREPATTLRNAVARPCPISTPAARISTVSSVRFRSPTRALMRSRSPLPVNAHPWTANEMPMPRPVPWATDFAR